MALSGATTSAGVDNASSIVDSKGNRIEVLQSDTFIYTVPPLDSSPLSIEFFHGGVASVKIDGPGADGFTGTKLTIGYQIGYSVALTGATVALYSPGPPPTVRSKAAVRLSGVHGYVQSATGPVTIRPYAKVVTSNGGKVVIYVAQQQL
ncbi:MspA family porin [Rhodococcus sp. IEGM 1379]|uniref:MspA family porin n=1 Tax=Rhodococcus sp. IEGM 1379 TaxID=3047086 RepID=UPI0024B813AD|nr:MspA family porin [Rhodococcus sp. IEGM 1379]MDI9918171.1 MspA family porin [Rhodococcus sp. IEGM 1379]